jgi:hypothetical protein
LANIKGNFELQKEGAKAANLPETWGLLTLDPDTRAKLKLPPGATWNDAFPGAKMPAKAQDEFKQYSTVEDLATTVKDALEKTYSDGQTGYQKYFLGAGFGSIADRLQNIAGQADPVVENIRPDIGKIFVAMKENAKVGSVVSPQEEKWVKSYAGGIERSLTPDRAKAIFDKLIPTVRQARLETVLSNSKSNRKEAVPETRTTQPTTDENTLPGGFRIGQ